MFFKFCILNILVVTGLAACSSSPTEKPEPTNNGSAILTYRTNIILLYDHEQKNIKSMHKTSEILKIYQKNIQSLKEVTAQSNSYCPISTLISQLNSSSFQPQNNEFFYAENKHLLTVNVAWFLQTKPQTVNTLIQRINSVHSYIGRLEQYAASPSQYPNDNPTPTYNYLKKRLSLADCHELDLAQKARQIILALHTYNHLLINAGIDALKLHQKS